MYLPVVGVMRTILKNREMQAGASMDVSGLPAFFRLPVSGSRDQAREPEISGSRKPMPSPDSLFVIVNVPDPMQLVPR